MLHIEQILVPTDYSPCADLALAHAIELALRCDAAVDLLHVEEPGVAAERAPSKAVAFWLQAEPERVVHKQVRSLGVVATISNAIEEAAYDLIVMGRHGHAGVRRFLVGSVTDEIVRTASCPIMTVRGEASPGTSTSVRSILLPTDFSEHAGVALRYAAVLARLYEAQLDVLHVVPRQALPSAHSIEPVPAEVRAVAARAQEALGQAIGEMAERPKRVVPHTWIGVPGRSIAEAADALGSDLVVMATHGRTGLRRLLLGSVTGQVLHRSPCPLFIVKSFGRSLLVDQKAAPQTGNEAAG